MRTKELQCIVISASEFCLGTIEGTVRQCAPRLRCNIASVGSYRGKDRKIEKMGMLKRKITLRKGSD